MWYRSHSIFDEVNNFFHLSGNLWEMEGFRTKPVHPKVKLHYHNFLPPPPPQKIKNLDFRGYFHLPERGRYIGAGTTILIVFIWYQAACLSIFDLNLILIHWEKNNLRKTVCSIPPKSQKSKFILFFQKKQTKKTQRKSDAMETINVLGHSLKLSQTCSVSRILAI